VLQEHPAVLPRSVRLGGAVAPRVTEAGDRRITGARDGRTVHVQLQAKLLVRGSTGAPAGD
jgi:hypothetical protein